MTMDDDKQSTVLCLDRAWHPRVMYASNFERTDAVNIGYESLESLVRLQVCSFRK